MSACRSPAATETWAPRTRFGLALLLAALAGPVSAQPSNAPPDRYGDRQQGLFGDQGIGFFGNSAAGNFDTLGVRTPPPGTRPLGRVYDGRAVEPPPYISLPGPVPEPEPPPAAVPQPAAKKKPAG
ncbi:MAG: hypothetical protein Q8Q73_09580 [Stagnimonas sp.]|nr:hypothetical protein [Stagnimonas sp.]